MERGERKVMKRTREEGWCEDLYCLLKKWRKKKCKRKNERKKKEEKSYSELSIQIISIIDVGCVGIKIGLICGQ